MKVHYIGRIKLATFCGRWLGQAMESTYQFDKVTCLRCIRRRGLEIQRNVARKIQAKAAQ